MIVRGLSELKRIGKMYKQMNDRRNEMYKIRARDFVTVEDAEQLSEAAQETIKPKVDGINRQRNQLVADLNLSVNLQVLAIEDKRYGVYLAGEHLGWIELEEIHTNGEDNGIIYMVAYRGRGKSAYFTHLKDAVSFFVFEMMLFYKG